jgi:3-oxoacyl-[acyl-carrier-protein] synthase-3
MPVAKISQVRVAGLAAAVPPLRATTWAELGVPDDRFASSRLVRRRPSIRAAAWEQCQSDFCQRAAEALLHQLGWAAADVDIVVMVTLTPDYPIPATAIILQDRLGLKKTALAFDLPGSQVTFLQALQLVASMLSAGQLRRALLLCGEVSKVVDGPNTIESADHICGHNGSVVALEHAPDAEPMFFQSGGDGSAHQSFFMPIGGTRRPPQAEMFVEENAAASLNPAMRYTLDLEAVEAAALRELPVNMRAVLAAAGKDLAELDHIFLQPITLATDDALRRNLGIPPDRFHSATREYGHGGSGGIVLAMLTRAARTLSGGPCTSLLAGIGAGLAWSSAVLSTEKVVCLEPIEM